MNSKISNSKKCICCKKSGHNITTCIPAKKQGILIENHIQAFMDICSDDEKKKSRLYQYLRNLSTTQKKILSNRVGEKHLTCSNVFRYFVEKIRSKNVMMKINGCTHKVLCRTLFSIPAEPIVCPSPSYSNKSERKEYEDDDKAWAAKKKEFWKQNNILFHLNVKGSMSTAEMAKLLEETLHR